MEFWGVEVKSGKSINVQPGEGMVIHLSQASLGDVKANKNEPVVLSVNVDGVKLVLGTLLPEKLPQQLFDLVFDRDFELSHNSKSGSISFFGYKAANPVEDEEGGFGDSEDSDDSEEEDIPLVQDNGKAEVKAKAVKPVVAEKAKETKDVAGKQKVKIVEPTKDEDEDDDSEDDDSDEDGSSDGDMMDEDDSDSEGEESDDEDDTPKKPSPAKKRGPDSAIKTPASQKKAKLVTPQKTDGKKSSGHVATPYPSKQAGKTPASKQSPKSGGSHSCGPCKKTFNSEGGLASHTKAKHSAAK